ncbi:MAG: hypothetical protein KDD37_04890, partial [Bdellovibrionales bacterium]|nr:hypothetical protein [Bdellovibrionales bacterium]
PSLVDGVELTGASYGGFIVGVMSALDSNVLFTRGTTIISPPLDFRYSLPYMDTLIDDELENAYEIGYWDLIKIGSDYLTASYYSDLGDSSRQNAKAFIAKHGFHDSIVNTIVTYDKVHNSGWVPKFDSRSDRLVWKKSIRFMNYFSTYAPEALDVLNSDVANLSYWINTALANGSSVRLLTAKNDFLNPPQFKTKIDFLILPQDVYLELPSGGHLGFLAFPWYKEFRQLAWQVTEDSPVKMLAHLNP